MPKLRPNSIPSEVSAVTFYQELCSSYHGIDDFRSKLLGLLPLATGAGAAVLIDKVTKDNQMYLEPIGYFGFVITMGLFVYEIFGIRKCHELIIYGRRMEALWLRIDDGQFFRRPHSLLGFVDEALAAGVIYPAVMASWLYIALMFSHPPAALPSAVGVFFAGLVAMVGYDGWLHKNWRKREEILMCDIEEDRRE